MSNTTPTPPRGTDAADATEDSRFTVEDAGTTTDPTDLFQNDTTAGGTTVDAGRSGTAGAVSAAAATSGPGTQADAASSRDDASGAVRGAGSPAAVAVTPAGSSRSGPSVDATAPVTDDRDAHDHADHDHAGHDHDHAGHDHDHADHDHAGHDHADHDHAGHDHADHDHAGHDHADHNDARHAAPRPPADDASIAHVFDQTNGVIEGIEGDSDGSAQSDVLSRQEREDQDPAFQSAADSEAQGVGGSDDSRRTGN